MGVPKSKRKESRFEADKHLVYMRTEITSLILNKFGFSTKKYEERLENYRTSHATSENLDEVVERFKTKLDSFHDMFIPYESEKIIDYLRNIYLELTLANSIFPSNSSGNQVKSAEIVQRRQHLNSAIGLCYVLEGELQYVLATLPVDINKFERFEEMINKEIALLKGVKSADARRFNSDKSATKKKRNSDEIRDFIDVYGKKDEDADDDSVPLLYPEYEQTESEKAIAPIRSETTSEAPLAEQTAKAESISPDSVQTKSDMPKMPQIETMYDKRLKAEARGQQTQRPYLQQNPGQAGFRSANMSSVKYVNPVGRQT